jgi:hypothetical protein
MGKLWNGYKWFFAAISAIPALASLNSNVVAGAFFGAFFYTFYVGIPWLFIKHKGYTFLPGGDSTIPSYTTKSVNMAAADSVCPYPGCGAKYSREVWRDDHARQCGFGSPQPEREARYALPAGVSSSPAEGVAAASLPALIHDVEPVGHIWTGATDAEGARQVSGVVEAEVDDARVQPWDVPSFACDLCGKTFDSEAGLRGHNYSKRHYPCSACGKAQASEDTLSDHIQACPAVISEREAQRAYREWEASQPATCDSCGETFDTKRDMRSHSCLEYERPVRSVPSRGRRTRKISDSSPRMLDYECKSCGLAFNHAFYHFVEKATEELYERSCPECGGLSELQGGLEDLF